MDSFTKQPSEKFTINIDFLNNISDETISNTTITAYLNDSDVTSEIIGTNSIDGTTVSIFVKNGSNNKNYKITCVINTSAGNTFEKDVLMRVREK